MIFWSWGRKKHCPPPLRPFVKNGRLQSLRTSTRMLVFDFWALSSFVKKGDGGWHKPTTPSTCSPEILDLKLIDGATENCQCWLALKQGSSHNSRSTKGGWRTGLGYHKNSTRFGIHHQPFGIFDLQRPSTSHRFDQAGLWISSCHHSSRSFVWELMWQLNIYTDASFGEVCVGCHLVMWDSSILLWKSGKQSVVTTSTAESKLVEILEGALAGDAVRVVLEEALDVKARAVSFTDNTA